jgi:Putative adhesin
VVVTATRVGCADMSSFQTPDPILAVIDLPLGSAHLIASERSDTMVVVNPTDPSRKVDVETAERTRIDLSGSTLIVKVPKSSEGSVDLTIELPELSRFVFKGGLVDLRADGRLARTRVQNGAGDVRLDETGHVNVVSGAGRVSVNHAGGDGEVTAAGDIEIASIGGNADIKNLNGRTWVGQVSDRLRVRSANGDIAADRVGSDVAARTANGNIQIGEVVAGSSTLATGSGSVSIGIGNGTTAWVDARTKFGRVHNSLEAAGSPDPDAKTIEIRARTSFGDITIHRSNQGGRN